MHCQERGLLTRRCCLQSFHRDARTTLASPMDSRGFCRSATLAFRACMLLYEVRTVDDISFQWAVPHCDCRGRARPRLSIRECQLNCVLSASLMTRSHCARTAIADNERKTVLPKSGGPSLRRSWASPLNILSHSLLGILHHQPSRYRFVC